MLNQKTKTQTQKIKEWLENGLSITRVEAYKQGFGLNLPARINELKKQGLKIVSEPAYDGSRERKYYLKGKNLAN